MVCSMQCCAGFVFHARYLRFVPSSSYTLRLAPSSSRTLRLHSVSVSLCTRYFGHASAQGWGTFEPSTNPKEKHATRRSLSGNVWNEEWEAVKMVTAARGERKKARKAQWAAQGSAAP